MNNKTAIITGGGGPNIGQAISHHLAEEGANVAILDINATAGREVTETITERGGEATFIKTDVTNVEAISHAVEEVGNLYDGIDILVNNAGRADGLTMESIDEETFDWNINQNLKSAFFCTKEVLPHLKETGGSVVFISSINAILGGFSEVAYASSKGGLHALCRGLTADYAKHGIRFNVICLGSVINSSSIWQEREENNPGTLDALAEIYPLKRYGKPEDVAKAVRFLTSEEASWITGVVLPVDGGLTASGNLPGGRWWENL